MPTKSWYLLLHWSARILAVLVAGFIFTFFFGEAPRPLSMHTLIPSSVGFRDGTLLALNLGAALAMLLAWIWEKWAGAADVLMGGAFLLCCIAMQGMHRVWFLGVALVLPGLLYMAAACLRDAELTPTHR